MKLPRPRNSKGKYLDKWSDTESREGGQRSPFRNLALLLFKLCQNMHRVQKVRGWRGVQGLPPAEEVVIKKMSPGCPLHLRKLAPLKGQEV